MYIYVLECRGGRYYVGKTLTPSRRLREHYNGTGALWTRKYRPLRTVLVVRGDKFDEDAYVLRYMEKYGIDKVRGGMYSRMTLDEDQIEQIWLRMESANDRCFCCSSDHFVRNCPIKKVKLTGIDIQEIREWSRFLLSSETSVTS